MTEGVTTGARPPGQHDPPAELLNLQQKRALRIALMLVEKGVHEVRQMLAHGAHAGILFRVHDDLDDDSRAALLDAIQEIHEIIRDLQARFHLAIDTEERRRVIAAKVALLWEIVTGTDATRLRGYGEVDSRLAALLDPSLDRLSLLLLRMTRCVSSPHRDRSTSGASGPGARAEESAAPAPDPCQSAPDDQP
jgi:hypothetical protein